MTSIRRRINAAQKFDGSEQSEDDFYIPLELLEEFIQNANPDNALNDALEKTVVGVAFPGGMPINMPETIDGFLDIVSGFYERLKNTKTDKDIKQILKNGKADVIESNHVFVQTDGGGFQSAKSDDPSKYEYKEAPRLALLIDYLRNDGVLINGKKQPIYMDDLRIHFGVVDPDMVRKKPYNLVQIPRLNIDISLCDEVGQVTFVKQGCWEPEFWAKHSKDELTARDDVWAPVHSNDSAWWKEISEVLSGQAQPTAKKVRISRWVPPMDLEMAKQTCLAHYRATGKLLKSRDKEGVDGKRGSYILRHGDYANGVLTVGGFEGRLRKIGSSVAKINDAVYIDIGIAGDDALARRKEAKSFMKALRADVLAENNGDKEALHAFLTAQTIDSLSEIYKKHYAPDVKGEATVSFGEYAPA